MAAVITLTTDFGLADGYVAAMKGVVVGINPAAVLVDISHSVPPQDIRRGAFVLGTTYQYFPEGTVHLAVVDPGVGTERRAIILKTPRACFVAPDNGLLSYVIHDYLTPRIEDGRAGLEAGSGLEAYAITAPRFRRDPVSATFHGRDIFAPAAAHLSLGAPLHEFGEAVADLSVFPVPAPVFEPDGSVSGRILYIDSFGNLVTNIRAGDLPEGAPLKLTAGGRVIRGLSRNYEEGRGLLAVIGGIGRLEIALKNGSAASFLGAGVGDEVRVYTQIQ
jgi:S-adenosylmethionine hydrolase